MGVRARTSVVTHVLGTQVPAAGGLNEICHQYVYRWLVASGRVTGNAPVTVTNLTARPTLFGVRGQPARVGGNIAVRRGCIIGFWDVNTGNLQHSMSAVAPDNWIGANNTGCFGSPGGRIAFQGVGTRVSGGAQHFGWTGAGHRWQGQFQLLEVTFKLPPRKHY